VRAQSSTRGREGKSALGLRPEETKKKKKQGVRCVSCRPQKPKPKGGGGFYFGRKKGKINKKGKKRERWKSLRNLTVRPRVFLLMPQRGNSESVLNLGGVYCPLRGAAEWKRPGKKEKKPTVQQS